MSQQLYKEPIIIRAKQGWKVRFWYEIPDNPGKFKAFEVKDGINYVKDLEERERQAQLLCDDLSDALRKGYNPFKEKIVAERTYESADETIERQKEDSKIKPWTMDEALDKYIAYCEWKNLSHNTIRGYKGFVKKIKGWMEEESLLDTPASECTESTMYDYLNEMNSEHGWSPRTYNNNAEFFVTLFNQIKKLERKENKAVVYKFDVEEVQLKANRAEKNRYYSSTVLDRVRKELVKYPHLNNYVRWIFYSCMRPREIRHLKVQHIDLANRQIKAIGPTAKTGDRFVPICDELFELIKTMELDKIPLDYYVFGDKQKPGPTIHPPARFSEIYLKIKQKLGLDQNYTLYSFKHTRCVNLLQAGFTDHEVMSLTGHTDFKSFEAYKRNFTIDAKAMKGKTIDF